MFSLFISSSLVCDLWTNNDSKESTQTSFLLSALPCSHPSSVMSHEVKLKWSIKWKTEKKCYTLSAPVRIMSSVVNGHVRFTSQKLWSCSSTVAHKHLTVFSFQRVFTITSFCHLWQMWPRLDKHLLHERYIFLGTTHIYTFIWMWWTINLYCSTEIESMHRPFYSGLFPTTHTHCQ